MISKQDHDNFLAHLPQGIMERLPFIKSSFLEIFIPYVNAKNKKELFKLLSTFTSTPGQPNETLWLYIALSHSDLKPVELDQIAEKLNLPMIDRVEMASIWGNVAYFQHLNNSNQILKDENNIDAAFSVAFKHSKIEILQFLKNQIPEEFNAQIDRQKLFKKIVSEGDLAGLKLLAEIFKEDMPDILGHSHYELYRAAAYKGNYDILLFLEGQASPKLLSEMRQFKDLYHSTVFYNARKSPNPSILMIEHLLLDPVILAEGLSLNDGSSLFGSFKLPDKDLFDILKRIKLSEEQIIKEAILRGDVGFFEYLVKEQPSVMADSNLEHLFATVCEHSRIGILKHLSVSLGVEKVKEIITSEQFLVNSKLQSNSYVLTALQELMPELTPQISTIKQELIKSEQKFMEQQRSKEMEKKQAAKPAEPKELTQGSNPKPTEVRNEQVKIDKLLIVCKNYQKHLNSQTEQPDSPSLQNKKLIVEKLIQCFDNTIPKKEQINNFKLLLTPENMETLSSKRSSTGNRFLEAGSRFLEAVAHILTVGIYSKITKGTFEFWKAHGEAFKDSAKEIIEDEKDHPTKKT